MASKATLAQEWPVFRPRGWGKPTRSRKLPQPWYGLDTERDAKSGRFVCGFAVGDEVVRFETLDDLPAGTYWVWNLAYDIEGMLRDLGTEEFWAAKRDGAKFVVDGARCVYYHGKRFDYVGADKRRRTFIEASSFYGRKPLKAVGAKDGGVDARRMSYERYCRDAEYRGRVDAYCMQDARIVFDRINELAEGLFALGIDIGATPGATARRFLNRMGQFPAILWQTHMPFLRSYCGGRFELTKRGVMYDVRQYDLVSAYPGALAKCPWLTDGAEHRHTRRFNDGAVYGSYLCEFDFEDYVGIAPMWNKGVRVYSRGERGAWLTRPEVDWLQRNGADVRVRRGVEIWDENATNLWGDVIGELFKMKLDNKGSPLETGAKIVLNSMYGVLIQLTRKSGEWVGVMDAKNPVDWAGMLALDEPPKAFEGGKYYAPVYAGNLTALVRLQVLDAAREIGPENYIGSHTDSVVCMGKYPGKIGAGLGEWELKDEAEVAHFAKTGMYAIGDKVKVRGITRNATPDVLWQETHTRKMRVGIKTARRWDDVSVIHEKSGVANNFAVDMKRVWDRDLTRSILRRGAHVDSEALSGISG